ncbi:DegV family protein [Psychrobacillus sp.]|uniref:DegV family protein n=1 Tax=Psychrobacillus sp. TaxID=1871623 RepID=UPI0028BE24BC|nr:DegV family protein [Psychrobacillus sp.]
MTTNKIAWVVDSTAFMSDLLKSHPDVYEVPLTIHFGQEQFTDGVDLTTDQLYERIRNSKESAKTSQPSAGEFAELYKKLGEQYEAIIAVHVSEKLSGTISSSLSGAEIAEVRMECVDSLALSVGITGLVEKGISLQKQDVPFDEIATILRNSTKNLRNYILIGNLTQLYKGGRLNSAQFYLGSLLKIKPIIQISDQGILHELDKVRSQKKALQYLIDKVIDANKNDGVTSIYLMHGNVIEQAEALKKDIQLQVPNVQITIGEISSSLAVHAGEGTLAVLWFIP